MYLLLYSLILSNYKSKLYLCLDSIDFQMKDQLEEVGQERKFTPLSQKLRCFTGDFTGNT